MAVADYYAEVQKIYVAYYGRPADKAGLEFWAGKLNAANGNLNDIINAFGNSAEAKTLYGNQQPTVMVNKIYNQLFGHDADPTGLLFYVGKLNSGEMTAASIALDVANGAQNADKTALDNKIAAAEKMTAAMDTTAEIVAYSGDAAAAAARTELAKVTDATDVTAFDGQAAVSTVVAAGSATLNAGKTFTLTTSVDNVVGGTGNDTFNAIQTGTSTVLGGLDVVDGGAGTDTLNIDDQATGSTAAFALPTGFTVKNVENLKVVSTGNIGDATTPTQFDLTGMSGLTNATLIAAGTTKGSNIKASNTTDVSLTVAGTAKATVAGGQNVTVNNGGVISVTGNGLKSVTVNKAATSVAIDNQGGTSGTTTATGTTMTSVTLNAVDANSTVKGAAIADLTITGATTAARTITVTNGTANHDLKVNVDGTGYTSTGGAAQTVVTDTVATTMTINATGAKSSVNVSGSTALTSLTITGNAALTANVGIAALTSIDGSAATGGLTLGTLNATTATVKTGSGNDSFTTKATTQMTVDAGAGNDVVTLGATVAAGSTINLGAGDDILKGSATINSTTALPTVIDAGDGVDTVSAGLITAGSAPLFKNFEGLDASAYSGAANTVDADLLTGSTISKVTLSGDGGNAGTITVDNLATSAKLFVSGDNSSAGATLNVKGAATATNDVFDIVFDGAAATTAPTAANVKAGTLTINNIETVNINSAGAANTWNSINITDSKLQQLTITGDKNLDLTFSGTNGGTGTGEGISLVDGSSATGALNINFTTGTPTLNLASGGLTVKGGSNKDTITLKTAATVDAGAGDDTIVSAAAGGTFTGGAGKDTFDVHLALYGSTPVVSTISDFVTADDTLKLKNQGTETFASTAVNVSTAQTLADALALAITTSDNGSTNAAVKWFQYAGNTYVTEILTNHTTGTAGPATTDLVVKLTGQVDLSGLTVADLAFV